MGRGSQQSPGGVGARGPSDVVAASSPHPRCPRREAAGAFRRDRTQPAGPLLSSNGSEQSYVGGTIVLVTRAARSDGGRRNEVVVGRVEQRAQLLDVLDDVIADGSRFVIMS